jgi:hypothetical protein
MDADEIKSNTMVWQHYFSQISDAVKFARLTFFIEGHLRGSFTTGACSISTSLWTAGFSASFLGRNLVCSMLGGFFLWLETPQGDFIPILSSSPWVKIINPVIPVSFHIDAWQIHSFAVYHMTTLHLYSTSVARQEIAPLDLVWVVELTRSIAAVLLLVPQ